MSSIVTPILNAQLWFYDWMKVCVGDNSVYMGLEEEKTYIFLS